MTKHRLLIEIVSETPCWLFREKAVCKACARSCVLQGLIQLLLRPPFLSYNETSVHSCGQSTLESTGCMHVSWVRGVALAVYILARVCAVFSPDWYMSFEHSSCFSFSKHLSQGFLCSGEPSMRQLCKGVCVSAYTTGYIGAQAALMLLKAHVTFHFDIAGQCKRARSACAETDGSLRIGLGCDEFHAPAQLTETSEMERTSKEASQSETEESSPAARLEALETSCQQDACRYSHGIRNVYLANVQQTSGGIWLNARRPQNFLCSFTKE